MLEKLGLVKLVEECGELTQIAAKKMTRMDTDIHWDGNGSLKTRLENEIADVRAISHVVIENFELDEAGIEERAMEKVRLFRQWMTETRLIDCPTCQKPFPAEQKANFFGYCTFLCLQAGRTKTISIS